MPTWTLNLFGAGLFDACRWRQRRRRSDIAPAARSPEAPQAHREVSRRRAEAMRGFFPQLASWIDQRGFAAEMNDVNRYLSQATDICDLERRIRDIERRDCGSRWFQ
jgi:hypothetical protein